MGQVGHHHDGSHSSKLGRSWGAPEVQLGREGLGQSPCSGSTSGLLWLQPVHRGKGQWLGTSRKCAQGCSGSEAGWHGRAVSMLLSCPSPQTIEKDKWLISSAWKHSPVPFNLLAQTESIWTNWQPSPDKELQSSCAEEHGQPPTARRQGQGDKEFCSNFAVFLYLLSPIPVKFLSSPFGLTGFKWRIVLLVSTLPFHQCSGFITWDGGWAYNI